MKIQQLLSIIDLPNITIREFELAIYGPHAKILIGLKNDVMIQAVYDEHENVHHILAVQGPEKLFWHEPSTYQTYLDYYFHNNLTAYTTDDISENEMLQQCQNVWKYKSFKDAIQIPVQLPFHVLEHYRSAAIHQRMSVEAYLAQYLTQLMNEVSALDIPVKVLTNAEKND